MWLFPIDSDHWIFYYVGHTWFSGVQLYVGVWDHKAPLIYAFNGVLSVLFGNNLAWHRVVLTLLALLDTFLFYRIAEHLGEGLAHPRLFARVALLLYVAFRNFSQFTNSGNNTENIGLIFWMLMILALLRWHQRRDSWGWLLAAGASLSILFWLKANFVLLSAPVWVELAIATRGTLGRRLLQFGGRGVLVLAPVALQSAFWIWYFGRLGDLHDLWVAAFQFNSKYLVETWQGHVSQQSIFILILLPFAFMFAVCAVWFLRSFREGRAFWSDGNLSLRLITVSALASTVFTLLLGSFYPYYTLIALPGYLLLISWVAMRLLTDAVVSRDALVAVSSALLIGIGLSFVFSQRELYNNFFGADAAAAHEDDAIVRYIDAHTSPGEPIVSYTYGAFFYAVADRPAGSRYISASHLLLDERDHLGFGLSDTFIADLEKSQPRYLIIAKDPTKSLYYENQKVYQYLAAHYAPEQNFQTLAVWHRVG